MATDETYNGWTNRETWAFNLHFGDDSYIPALLAHTIIDYDVSWTDDADIQAGARLGAAAETLQDYWEQIQDEFSGEEGVRSAMRDIGSDWRINWNELVRVYMSDDVDCSDWDDDPFISMSTARALVGSAL